MTTEKAIEELERLTSDLMEPTRPCTGKEWAKWTDRVSNWIADYGPIVLAALRSQAAPRPAVPASDLSVDQWKLVPAEPTETMIRAALNCQDADPEDGQESEIYHWYQAMIVAAPENPDGRD